MLSNYYRRARIEAKVRAGKHRETIGGHWEALGELQLTFLRSRGLEPHHTVLDVGCGSLRAGVKLVRYLDAGNYFGTDLNASLLDAGYDVELAAEGLTEKLPRSHLVVDGEFDFSWARRAFDFAIAQSVFTHLPLNHIRICLERLSAAMAKGGQFYMTFFEIPESHPASEQYQGAKERPLTHGGQDPYHYRFSDIEYACKGLPWRCTYIGDWGHPRHQYMVEFIRT